MIAMTKRVFPDRPLTAAEMSARWWANNIEKVKAWQAKNQWKSSKKWNMKNKERMTQRHKEYWKIKAFASFLGALSRPPRVRREKDRRSRWSMNE